MLHSDIEHHVTGRDYTQAERHRTESVSHDLKNERFVPFVCVFYIADRLD